jgi:hypothetical protein
MQYIIQNINAWSAFKFGGVIGGILSFLPGLVMGLTVRALTRTMRTWLESWFSLDLPLVGNYSLLEALRLNEFLARLQYWDDRSWLLVVMIILLSMVGGGVIMALLGALGAAVYNLVAALSGGLVVQAQRLEGIPSGAAMATPMAAPGQPALAANYPQAASPAPASPAAAEPAAWLTAQSTQHSWPIGQGETRIGSGPDNQVRLNGLAVNHAAIRWENGRFILHDFSGGQTWVNGRSLMGPNMLKDGFQIRLASQEFLFRSS